MNKNIFVGKWEEIKGKLKQQWGKLTDDDFLQVEGAHQEIYGKLQEHYGYSEDDAKNAVKKFQESLQD